MSVYLFLDEQREPFSQVATNHGWAGVDRWFRSIDFESYKQLWGLVLHGLSNDPSLLLTETINALVKFPPDELGVSDTLEKLIATLKKVPDGIEVAYVSDGTMVDED